MRFHSDILGNVRQLKISHMYCPESSRRRRNGSGSTSFSVHLLAAEGQKGRKASSAPKRYFRKLYRYGNFMSRCAQLIIVASLAHQTSANFCFKRKKRRDRSRDLEGINDFQRASERDGTDIFASRCRPARREVATPPSAANYFRRDTGTLERLTRARIEEKCFRRA